MIKQKRYTSPFQDAGGGWAPGRETIAFPGSSEKKMAEILLRMSRLSIFFTKGKRKRGRRAEGDRETFSYFPFFFFGKGRKRPSSRSEGEERTATSPLYLFLGEKGGLFFKFEREDFRSSSFPSSIRVVGGKGGKNTVLSNHMGKGDGRSSSQFPSFPYFGRGSRSPQWGDALSSCSFLSTSCAETWKKGGSTCRRMIKACITISSSRPSKGEEAPTGRAVLSFA